MGMTIAQKILKAHLVDGEMVQGQEIGLKIDQTLTQDATGTMAYLQFEAMGVDQVRTERSVAYIDHNTLQSGFENADDHKYIGSVAKKHGIYYSKAGNGICHQVHLERFGAPGKTLIGSDSHTPTGGGIGMLAFGAGGLDVAVAMGGGEYYIPMPKMVRVNLTGKLSPWVSAKDVILDVLRQMTVKGGVGKIVEYAGEGVKTLSVPERATITNMGAELGATTSIFPSDEETKKFLEAQGRGDVWVELSSDPDAVYDEEYTVDLSALEPLAAMPHMPDNVKPVSEIGAIKVNQCCIGFLLRYDEGRVHFEGQDRAPGRFADHQPGFQAGIQYARAERRAGGHHRGGRAHSGMRLRPLHRHGSVSGIRRRVPAYLQPQL